MTNEPSTIETGIGFKLSERLRLAVYHVDPDVICVEQDGKEIERFRRYELQCWLEDVKKNNAKNNANS